MTLVVDERAGDAQINAAAGVNVDSAITRHHPLARQTELRIFALITEAGFHGGNRFLDGDESFEFFGS